ncbi:MAG: hypothetical protein U0Y10_05140 [Spirosomataceae bacterium]
MNWGRSAGFLLVVSMIAPFGGCKQGELWNPEKIAQASGYYEGVQTKAQTDPNANQSKPLPSKPEDTDYLDNGIIRIGVNKGAGGVITYLADSKQKVNLVNNYDLGRQIQISFYSGPTPFAPNGKQPKGGWEHTGWNPVQAGDVYGNWSKTLEFKNDNKVLYVKATPMQWALNAEPCDCTIETWIELDNNVAKVRHRLSNQRSDKTQYNGYVQELPAIYTNAALRKIVSYTGEKPFTNDAADVLTPAKANTNTYFHATESWAALLRDDNWGVGIYQNDGFYFAGASFSFAGGTDEFSPSAGYLSPLKIEVLDHNIVYEYGYSLIVGSLSDIRQYAYQQNLSKRYLPDYQFTSDRQHWFYIDGVHDTGFPMQGELTLPLEKEKVEMYSPVGFWYSSEVSKLYIKAAFQTDAPQGRLYWRRWGETLKFVTTQSLTFPIINDRQYHTYEINLSTSPDWKGGIIQLMLAPIDTQPGKAGQWMKLKSISYKP